MSKGLPTYEEALERFRLVVDDCKNFAPPLTEEEEAGIWAACRTGSPVFLRNKAGTSPDAP